MGTPAYDKKNTVMLSLKFNRKTDADILLWMSGQESFQGAIKRLIREDIERITREGQK